MGTEKRERQKANRQRRLAEEAKAAKVTAVKRNVARTVAIIVAAVAAVVLIVWISGGFGDDEAPIVTIPLTAPLTLPDTSDPLATSPSTVAARDAATVPSTTAP